MDSALFAEDHLQTLLDIGRAAGSGTSFQERMGALVPLVQRLVPGRVMASVHDADAPAKLAVEPGWFYGGDLALVHAYAQRYMKLDPLRPAYAEASGEPALLSDTEVGRRYGQDPFTAEFLTSHGIRHCMLCVHRMPDGAVFAFALYRGPEQPDFDARERALLGLCSPDLARAIRGLVLQRALQANAAAPGSASGVHGVAFDREGRVVHADLGSSLLLDEAALRELGEQVATRAQANHAQLGTVTQLSLQTNGGSALPVRLLALDAQSGVAALAMLTHEATDSRFERLVLEARLTARERQVAALAIDGLRNRDIADRLGVGVDTIKWHLKTIFLKTKVRGRGGLAAIVLGRG